MPVRLQFDYGQVAKCYGQPGLPGRVGRESVTRVWTTTDAERAGPYRASPGTQFLWRIGALSCEEMNMQNLFG